MRSRFDVRALGSSCLNIANQAVSPLDRLAQRSPANRPGPIFLVGLPRSGTSLAYELIVQAFDVAFLTRAYSYLYGLPNITTRLTSGFTRSPTARYESTYGRIPGMFSPAENHVLWKRWFRTDHTLGHYAPPGILSATALKAIRNTAGSMAAIAGRPFVFKNIYFSMSLRSVLEALPRSRIIIVERDFEAVCASVYRARKEHGGAAWWSIRPPFYETFIDKDVVSQTVFQCMRATQLMERELQQAAPGRCLTVSYDEICGSPHTCLGRIQEWAEVVLEPRPEAEIPASFTRRGVTEVPDEIRSEIKHLREVFSHSRDQYMRQIEDQLVRPAYAGAAW